MRLSLFLYFYALPAAAQAFWYFPYTLSAAARIPASLSQALTASPPYRGAAVVVCPLGKE